MSKNIETKRKPGQKPIKISKDNFKTALTLMRQEQGWEWRRIPNKKSDSFAKHSCDRSGLYGKKGGRTDNAPTPLRRDICLFKGKGVVIHFREGGKVEPGPGEIIR
jgi:hypothetical protein